MSSITDVEPTTVAQLRDSLANLPVIESGYPVAVEGLVFDSNGNWILMERGGSARDEVGKLEGIGGRVEGTGDMREELHREIAEEVGSDANVEIIAFLEVKSDTVVHKGVQKTWIIASYLCRHILGPLQIAEPEKNLGFVYVSELDVQPERLSSSCQQSLATLRRRWPWVRKQLGLE